jgi:voltage-gated potassium channel
MSPFITIADSTTRAAGLVAVAANPTLMEAQTRSERWIDRRIAHAATPRGAAIVIASVTTSITIIAGLLMTIIDREHFPSLGSGLWWGVQTVTTVGYGDHVPTSGAGQILAALVMLLGIGFITVITASITSSLVTRSGREKQAVEDGAPSAEQMRRIDERLERIEAALNGRPGGPV